MKATLAAVSACAIFLSIAVSAGRSSPSPPASDRQFHIGSDTYAELAKAPEKAAVRQNPLENDADAVAAGRLLFEDHCAECHGDDGKGGRKGPSLRVSEVRNATPGTLFWLLTNGVVRKKMPAWSKLPEPQRWQLVRFLKASEASKP